MTQKYNGGAAFPLEGSTKRNASAGMSLRDYLAASAIQGMLANDALLKRYAEDGAVNLIDPEVLMATAAYSIADVVIAERAK